MLIDWDLICFLLDWFAFVFYFVCWLTFPLFISNTSKTNTPNLTVVSLCQNYGNEATSRYNQKPQISFLLMSIRNEWRTSKGQLWTKLKTLCVQCAEKCVSCTFLREAIWNVTAARMTCRHTLNPCWCLFWACYCSKRSAHGWWHFLCSPSSRWNGGSLTNQAALPGASQSGFHRQTAAQAYNTCSKGVTLHQQPATDLLGSTESLAKVVPHAQISLNGQGVDFLSGRIRNGDWKGRSVKEWSGFVNLLCNCHHACRCYDCA